MKARESNLMQGNVWKLGTDCQCHGTNSLTGGMEEIEEADIRAMPVVRGFYQIFVRLIPQQVAMRRFRERIPSTEDNHEFRGSLAVENVQAACICRKQRQRIAGNLVCQRFDQFFSITRVNCMPELARHLVKLLGQYQDLVIEHDGKPPSQRGVLLRLFLSIPIPGRRLRQERLLAGHQSNNDCDESGQRGSPSCCFLGPQKFTDRPELARCDSEDGCAKHCRNDCQPPSFTRAKCSIDVHLPPSNRGYNPRRCLQCSDRNENPNLARRRKATWSPHRTRRFAGRNNGRWSSVPASHGPAHHDAAHAQLSGLRFGGTFACYRARRSDQADQRTQASIRLSVVSDVWGVGLPLIGKTKFRQTSGQHTRIPSHGHRHARCLIHVLHRRFEYRRVMRYVREPASIGLAGSSIVFISLTKSPELTFYFCVSVENLRHGCRIRGKQQSLVGLEDRKGDRCQIRDWLDVQLFRQDDKRAVWLGVVTTPLAYGLQRLLSRVRRMPKFCRNNCAGNLPCEIANSSAIEVRKQQRKTSCDCGRYCGYRVPVQRPTASFLGRSNDYLIHATPLWARPCAGSEYPMGRRGLRRVACMVNPSPAQLQRRPLGRGRL